MSLQPGLSARVELVVGDGDTALAMRSGEVPVLSTPRLIALCEEAAFTAVGPELDEGQTSVGMKVQLDHLAPSAVGHLVVAEAVVEKVAGRKVLFTVSVNDERGLLAVGRMTRVVVDADQFVAKASGQA